MIALIQSKAAQGDPEAIKTLQTLRAMNLINEEAKEVEEPKIWEILDQCRRGSNRYRKSAGR